jgi:membrane-associated phospholipid phosphatase
VADSTTTVPTERQLDPAQGRGSALILAIATAAVCAVVFTVLTLQVEARVGITRVDPRLESFVVAHRVGWVTSVSKVVAWIGSSFLLIPLILIVGAYVWVKRRDWKPLMKLAVALGGAIALYNAAKVLIDRARPPARMRVGEPVPGGSFPSGHTMEAIAVWGMVAVLAAGALSRRRWAPVAGAVAVVLIVGAVRVYLGTHWLSDVIAGYALGGCWLAVVVAIMVGRGRRQQRNGRTE